MSALYGNERQLLSQEHVPAYDYIAAVVAWVHESNANAFVLHADPLCPAKANHQVLRKDDPCWAGERATWDRCATCARQWVSRWDFCQGRVPALDAPRMAARTVEAVERVHRKGRTPGMMTVLQFALALRRMFIDGPVFAPTPEDRAWWEDFTDRFNARCAVIRTLLRERTAQPGDEDNQVYVSVHQVAAMLREDHGSGLMLALASREWLTITRGRAVLIKVPARIVGTPEFQAVEGQYVTVLGPTVAEDVEPDMLCALTALAEQMPLGDAMRTTRSLITV